MGIVVRKIFVSKLYLGMSWFQKIDPAQFSHSSKFEKQLSIIGIIIPQATIKVFFTVISIQFEPW